MRCNPSFAPCGLAAQGLLETIWLLFTSVLVVPAVCKLPGGSPVLGFLAGGALIGPHALGARPAMPEVIAGRHKVYVQPRLILLSLPLTSDL